jgi:transcriptional regulator with XRE-family HTH domain
MKRPTGQCIEREPNKASVKFCSRFINLSEIARTQGLQPATVSRIFSGIRMPSLQSAIKIADALEMTVDNFLGALAEHRRRIEREKEIAKLTQELKKTA